ncbi:putative MFS transporter [Aspergillus homomorphus CBS 101889]|uniref:MFS general substrate transporter n=1 Tax=Aspergillus homomorphus (strain CBS 101889) TaxID=1450537 RepID=A0A395I9L8_ASPHC|nr:MFS general substrate transporter [Aspergillus homomorphus CBS 101889]RAL16960.1 MFS general substrate transporter [Aspergillus homomorphus CBS 101889]
MSDIETGFKGAIRAHDVEDTQSSKVSIEVGQEHLAGVVPPHASYEGFHRFDPTATWTEKEERRFFGLQLDRGNLSNALTDNFLKDLNMSSNDYNNGTTIQLVCFLSAEFPVQLLIKRYGFKRVLPVMMICWSTVSWAQAWMTSRAGFYVTRALIGAFEGGFIPGTILFATYFYKTKELSVRLGFFWSTLNVARIISSLLAAGILEMRGMQGKPGWFWLFLIDGLITFVIGVVSLFYLPSSPTNTTSLLCPKTWYTEREEVIMINRLLRDDPSKGLTHINESATVHDILSAWKDPSMWGLYLIGLVAYIPQGPVSSYLSLTLKRLGFTTFQSNMLSIPSAALQIILMLLLCKSSDYFGDRTWHSLLGEFWSLPLLVALLCLPAGGDNWARFAITTLISGYPYFHPIVSAWISENTFDVKKRAITAATYNVIVQVGSIISSRESMIYRSSDSPYYYTGNKVLVALCVFSMAVFVAQREYLRYLNRQKEKKWALMSQEERILYQADKETREREGNKRLDFRFKY